MSNILLLKYFEESFYTSSVQSNRMFTLSLVLRKRSLGAKVHAQQPLLGRLPVPNAAPESLSSLLVLIAHYD